MTPAERSPSLHLDWLEHRIGLILKGKPVRNIDEDIAAVRSETARLREIVRLYVDPSDVRPEHEATVRECVP